MEKNKNFSKRKKGIYERFIKRFIDIICSASAIVILSPIFIILLILIRTKLGSPVIYTQYRPGKLGEDGKEKIFKMYKFRTMTNTCDENGELLPDSMRMTPIGLWMRQMSLDELPELINILKGDMSLVGPRPQLVKDMVFMTEVQRKRHEVRPGLSGLAQVNGRNAIPWEDKLLLDLEYIKKVTFIGDVKIIFMTLCKVLKKENINREGTVSDIDFGDWLLQKGIVTQEEYTHNMIEASELLNKESS